MRRGRGLARSLCNIRYLLWNINGRKKDEGRRAKTEEEEGEDQERSGGAFAEIGSLAQFAPSQKNGGAFFLPPSSGLRFLLRALCMMDNGRHAFLHFHMLPSLLPPREFEMKSQRSQKRERESSIG